MNNRTEQSYDFRDILFYVAKKWRLLLVFIFLGIIIIESVFLLGDVSKNIFPSNKGDILYQMKGKSSDFLMNKDKTIEGGKNADGSFNVKKNLALNIFVGFSLGFLIYFILIIFKLSSSKTIYNIDLLSKEFRINHIDTIIFKQIDKKIPDKKYFNKIDNWIKYKYVSNKYNPSTNIDNKIKYTVIILNELIETRRSKRSKICKVFFVGDFQDKATAYYYNRVKDIFTKSGTNEDLKIDYADFKVLEDISFSCSNDLQFSVLLIRPRKSNLVELKKSVENMRELGITIVGFITLENI